MAEVGWRAIAARYQLTAHADDDCGVFDWKRRMGQLASAGAHALAPPSITISAPVT